MDSQVDSVQKVNIVDRRDCRGPSECPAAIPCRRPEGLPLLPHPLPPVDPLGQCGGISGDQQDEPGRTCREHQEVPGSWIDGPG